MFKLDKTPDPAALSAAHLASEEFKAALKQAQEETDKGVQLLKFDSLNTLTKAKFEELEKGRNAVAAKANRWGWGLVALGVAVGFGLGTLGGVAIAAALAIPAAGASVVGASGAAVLATFTSAIAGRMVGAAKRLFNDEHKELAETLVSVSAQSIVRSFDLQQQDPQAFAGSAVKGDVFKRFPALKARFDAEAARQQEAQPPKTEPNWAYRPFAKAL